MTSHSDQAATGSTATSAKARAAKRRRVPSYPHPPFPEQTQELPGSFAEMEPQPDHGETSWQGTARLEGQVALITGGDSGIGRARWRLPMRARAPMSRSAI